MPLAKERTNEMKIFSHAIETSIDGIIIGDLSGKINYVNNALMKMYGTNDKGEFIGRYVVEFIAERDRERATQRSIEALTTGNAFAGEFTALTKSGAEIPVEVTVTIIQDENGKDIGFVDILRDITERKKAEQKLEEYRENLEKIVEERTKELMEVQNRLLKTERLAAIGELAGMVGHDLRNPLAGIKNAAYFLRKKQGSFIGEDGSEMLSVIDRAVEQANNVVADLLDYSREIHLEFEEYSPKSLIDYVLLSITVPPKVKIIDHTQNSPMIKVDAGKMERVFINLIKNAIEAMPNGGTLEIGSAENSDDVQISFADSGVGMPEDVLAKLFTPLFTTKSRGMGLGLPICKRIVEAHGGNISVQSLPNKGTTFTIRMPS
jgi:PAS domain S-box-containing protein